MKTLPGNVSAYQRTPEFDEASIPKGLRKAHQTNEGVWGKIVVLAGRLKYTINEPVAEIFMLDENNPGIVEPIKFHEIEPQGRVRPYVEFYR